MISSDINIISL